VRVPGATFLGACPRSLSQPRRAKTPERDTAWAMSEENVEIVRALFDTFARRDHGAAFEYYDAEIELSFAGGWGGPRGDPVGPMLRSEKQRREVRQALANGENVKAKVTVSVTDAVGQAAQVEFTKGGDTGNVATAKRTITLVK
jgi:hypothetical protein